MTTAAAIATTCGACRGPLQPDQPLSLSVDITESTAPDGTEYVTFTDYVCHNPDDAGWLEAAGKGCVLIIGGDNLVINETKLDVDAAARLGTLVIGYVPVHS